MTHMSENDTEKKEESSVPMEGIKEEREKKDSVLTEGLREEQEKRELSSTEEPREEQEESASALTKGIEEAQEEKAAVQAGSADEASKEKTASGDGSSIEIANKFKQNNNSPRRELVGVDNKQMETKRMVIFLVLCFGVAWIVEFFAVTPLYKSNDVEAVKEAVDMISQMMFTPAIAALVARLLTREGLVKSGFQLNFGECKFLFLFGWFGMTILTFLGAVIYFLVYRNNFDPNMTEYVASYSAAMTDVYAENTSTPTEIIAAFKTDLLLKVFSAPLLDIINAFGVEWGFRAYLVPKLYRKIGAVPSMVLGGFISGLWYAPLVALGYYYGTGYSGFPITGIIAMCIFGTVTGIISSYLCLRTGSIFPSIFAVSSLNVMMSQAALFTFDGGSFFVGPAPTGIIAGIPLIIVAVIFVADMARNPVKPSESRK